MYVVYFSHSEGGGECVTLELRNGCWSCGTKSSDHVRWWLGVGCSGGGAGGLRRKVGSGVDRVGVWRRPGWDGLPRTSQVVFSQVGFLFGGDKSRQGGRQLSASGLSVCLSQPAVLVDVEWFHTDTFCSRDTFCVSHMMGFNFLSLQTFRCYNPSTGCGVIPALSFRPLSWSERTGQSTTQSRVLRWSYRVFQSLKTGRTATELDCVLVEAGPTSWRSNSTARRGGVYPCQPLGLLECWQRQWPELRSSVEGDGTVSHLPPPPRSDSSGVFAIDFRDRVLLFLLWTASWGEEKLHE